MTARVCFRTGWWDVGGAGTRSESGHRLRVPKLADRDVGVQYAIFSAFVDFKISVFFCFFKLPFCKMGMVSSTLPSCRGHHRWRAGSPHTVELQMLLVTGSPEHSTAHLLVPGSYSEGRGPKVASHSSTGPTTLASHKPTVVEARKNNEQIITSSFSLRRDLES